tara:strand:+ start:151 stop:498 length:348 start_codon:yes stop_codon:yes gene_type:complete
MRKIEKDLIQAIKNKKNWCKSNTHIVYTKEADRVEVYLHGNHIVNLWFTGSQVSIVYITDAGWESNTTKSRLNAICSEFCPDIHVYRKNWDWYLGTANGSKEWDGSYTHYLKEVA